MPCSVPPEIPLLLATTFAVHSPLGFVLSATTMFVIPRLAMYVPSPAASTLMGTDADFVGSATEVAVIVVLPTETPVTTPDELTLAFVGSLLDHATAVDAPPVTMTVGVSVSVDPTSTTPPFGETET